MEHAQLTPDIIHDLIIEPLPTLDICRKHQLSVDQLHALVTSDQFKQLADQLTDIDQARAPFTRARMLDILNGIAQLEPQSPTHTETIRKAAAQLLRLTEPREHNAQAAAESENPPPETHSPQDHHEETAQTPGRDAAAPTTPPQSDPPPPHEHTRQLDKEPIAPPSAPQRQQSTRRNNKSRKRKR
tara:strand:+ start:35810 stop:36367 length:558 start_codon:yes stop_codon:yes gene_type:complete